MKKILITVLLLCSANALAGWSTSAGKVTRVYSHNGAHVIRTTIIDAVCSPGSFWWPADDADAKDMFALALSAFMAGKNITVVYDSGNLNCQHGNSAKITHMSIF